MWRWKYISLAGNWRVNQNGTMVQYSITQRYSPFEKAAQLYAKNESVNVTNQQHKTLKRYLGKLAQSTQ